MSRFKGRVITDSEHVFVAGRTGSGKTYLTEKYMAGFAYVACLDTKGKVQMPSVPPELVQVVTRLADLPYVTKPYIIYRPVWEELKLEYYDEFFKWCYRRGNTVVWVDEVFGVCPNPSVIPEWYRAILTRGRELHVAVWSCTQRPMGIPNVIMSESNHFFVYDLNMEQDREKIVTITGAEEFEDKPTRIPIYDHNGRVIKTEYQKYTFWYFAMEGMEHPVRCQLAKPA